MSNGAIARCWIDKVLGEEGIDEISDKIDNLFPGGAVGRCWINGVKLGEEETEIYDEVCDNIDIWFIWRWWDWIEFVGKAVGKVYWERLCSMT